MDLDVLGKNAHALMGFKAELDEAMPEFRKALADFTALMGDFAKIKETMGPALEWVAAQQKAVDDAKAAAEAAERQKADDAAKALDAEKEEAARKATASETDSAQTTDAMRDEHSAHEPAGADKPLAHLAEVEASIGGEVERSESEHSVG